MIIPSNNYETTTRTSQPAAAGREQMGLWFSQQEGGAGEREKRQQQKEKSADESHGVLGVRGGFRNSSPDFLAGAGWSEGQGEVGTSLMLSEAGL